MTNPKDWAANSPLEQDTDAEELSFQMEFPDGDGEPVDTLIEETPIDKDAERKAYAELLAQLNAPGQGNDANTIVDVFTMGLFEDDDPTLSESEEDPS